MIFQSAATWCMRPRQDFSTGTAKISGRPQDFRRRMWFMLDLVPAHFSMPESCVSARRIGRNVSSPTRTETPWALRLGLLHLSPLRYSNLASMWSVQGPDSRWLRQMPGILEQMFQSVACLCGLCKEVGVVTLTCYCCHPWSSPDCHPYLRATKTLPVIYVCGLW